MDRETRRPRRSSERGAILIQVGVALIVLIAFSMFVIDYGIMWVSRGQVQNAADAGALAGAVALAFDDSDDFSPSGPAQVSARTVALRNFVFGEAGDVQFNTTGTNGDIHFSIPEPNPSLFPSECLAAGTSCIRVDVHRTQTRSNPLPTWFGSLVGVTSQGVRATATAWVVPGNAVECLRPFAVPQLYQELGGDPDLFDLGIDQVLDPNFNLDDHLGMELMLKGGPSTQLAPGWFRLIDIVGDPGPGGGAPDIWASIRGCAANVYGIGDTLQEEPGNIAAARSAIQDLIDLDPGASWDDTAKEIVGSCVSSHTCYRYDSEGRRVADPGATQSPRIIALPVFDIEHFAMTGEIVITNIFGFFVTHMTGNPGHMQVFGRLVTQPGLVRGGGGPITPEESFLKVVQLVR